jgi:lysophospholipase L1-like esterase
MKIVLSQLLKMRIIFSASISAALVVMPIWAAGLSVAKTIIYLVISSLVMITVRLSWSKPALRTIVLGFGLAVALSIVLNESESIVTFGIRAFSSSLIFLSLLIYGNPTIFRVAVVNFSILLVLMVSVEIGFRFVVQSQESSQYEVIELFRNDRNDGPGAQKDVSINTDKSGLRVTTDQPSSAVGRILIFGGSTTFCGEVEDEDTFPSQLQRSILSAGFNMRVENYGKSAATATDRVEVLRDISDLSANDVVVFYIGVNEAGVGFTQRDVPVQFIRKVPELGTALQKASSYSRVSDFLFRSLVFGGVSVTEQSKLDAVNKLEKALSDAQLIAAKVGADFVPVLQANLFTREPKSDYDRVLGSMYGSELELVVTEIYARMDAVVRTYPFAGDATGVMNDLDVSPFYDWHHVDENGNQRIANFIFDLLSDKELLR